jgi:tRNA (cmo5U34)-methyltransferase
MLDICRQKAEACSITGRCTFHEGYVDSLPTSDSFDAATSLLVSHFIMEPEDRIEFFHQIALRLRPQGYLISSDIAYDLSSSTYPGILEIWLQMMKSAGLPPEQIDKMRHVYGRDVAVLPLPAVASIIAAGGFESPVLFFQSLLIHGWYARRNTILQSHG